MNKVAIKCCKCGKPIIKFRLFQISRSKYSCVCNECYNSVDFFEREINRFKNDEEKK